MKICKWLEPINVAYRKSGGGYTVCLEPHRDFVLSDAQLDKIMDNEMIRTRLYKQTHLEPRLVPFKHSADNLRNGPRSVLFYNGSGGYGDQIMSWPVAKWLADQGYEVHIATDPGNTMCWFCFPWVKVLHPMPMPYETFKMFDYHVVMEHVVNRDEHPDQLHPVDAMFTRIGVDPATVSPLAKVVEPLYTWAELQQARAVFAERKRLGMFQLTSANSVRAQLPSDTAFMLMKLAQATPDVHWLALYDEFNLPAYMQALSCRTCNGTGIQPISEEEAKAAAAESKALDGQQVCKGCAGCKTIAPNIELYSAGSLRELWALTKTRASVVVAPDSMMVHVAGSQGVPCIGLWGPTDPTRRTAYYRGHHAVFHKEACPHAPCFSYLAHLPKYCPPRGPERKVCEVVASATPAEVIEAVKKIMR